MWTIHLKSPKIEWDSRDNEKKSAQSCKRFMLMREFAEFFDESGDKREYFSTSLMRWSDSIKV